MHKDTTRLRRTMADIENAASSDKDEQPQQKRKKTKQVDTDKDGEIIEKHRANVNHLAHKCVILYSFWLHNGKGTFTMAVDPEYVEANRFESLETKAQGQLADLLELLPESLKSKEVMESEWFATRVSLSAKYTFIYTN